MSDCTDVISAPDAIAAVAQVCRIISNVTLELGPFENLADALALRGNSLFGVGLRELIDIALNIPGRNRRDVLLAEFGHGTRIGRALLAK